MLKLQNTILETIARGDSLASTAHRICVEAELLASGVICSILTVDRSGLIHPLAGPGLPDGFNAALEGVAIGPMTGSCGTAAYYRSDVAVIDIAKDERWAAFRHLALPLGLRACWSSPIIDAHGAVLGTFAFYYRDARGPTELERQIVRYCVRLCVIALDRHQRLIEHERRAFTDALTGLANRAAFNLRLDGLSCAEPGSWALLVLDLDNLKTVNDTFGHPVGDNLLIKAGERIALAMGSDAVFRVGGDEFAVIIQHPEALRDIDQTAEKALLELTRPADCGGNIVVPRATIGGAVMSAGDLTPERVRQNADFALYHAKETGRGGFVRYWPGLGTSMTRRLGQIRDVDAALREGRIDAFYQPIVRLDTREIVGLEALCRMRLGDSVVSAAAFHEVTKDVHIASALTERMMAIVAKDVRTWLDMGIPFQHVGINVSSADVHRGTLDRVMTSAFQRWNVPLRHVILEITEAVYMGDDGQSVQKEIKALRSKGLKVALDDFGTGYASLTHLLTVPIDIIKIDKTFVDRLAADEGGMAIIEGIIQIAGKLKIRIVAEGIETELQADQLGDAGCILGQGYLFSRAVDRDETTALLLCKAQQPADHSNHHRDARYQRPIGEIRYNNGG